MERHGTSMPNRGVTCAFTYSFVAVRCVRANGVRWWRDAVFGVADGAVARAKRASRAGGTRAASTVPQPVLIRWRWQPPSTTAPTSQQCHVSYLHQSG